MAGPVRIALFGASGAGKSTTGQLLRDAVRQRGLAVSVVKLAEPLYDVQRLVYSLCGRPVADPYQQDGLLLSALGDNFRRIDPLALVRLFAARVEQAEAAGADLIVCDDMRRPDCAALVGMGFQLVRISAPDAERVRRRTGRGDLAPISDQHGAEAPIGVAPHFEIHNDSTVRHLRHQVEALAVAILGEPASIPASRRAP